MTTLLTECMPPHVVCLHAAAPMAAVFTAMEVAEDAAPTEVVVLAAAFTDLRGGGAASKEAGPIKPSRV
jgi:hypothetical protein